MRLSGFTFVRNAVLYDFPVVESIKSILPICDEFIVNVGPSEDNTIELIKSIDSSKIRIIQSQWNPNIKTGGYIYAQQTNIALFNCMGKWAFYIQADEVVHEEDLPVIKEFLDKYIDDDGVEGLLLNELTFWGDYKTLIRVYPWKYSKRAWIVKPHLFILSRGDASGFTVHPKYKERGRRIKVLDTPARIFHYSFVKSEKYLNGKYKDILKFWKEKYSCEEIKKIEMDFYKAIPRKFVTTYSGSHPKVIEERLKKHKLNIDLSSPNWRTRLTHKEIWRILQTKLIENKINIWSNRSFKIIRV